MNTKKLTKLLALYLPYILLGLVATNFGEAWRLAEGKELGERIMSMMGTLPAAFANPLPSLHPLDLLIGISCGAGLRLAVYLRSKNAKKYRHGMEYGSARWGTAKDIEPFQAPKFEDNIILTKTERLMMSNRPSDPKNARNKNVLIVGGSGSGKTRFWLKPNLLQMHSSYVVTDPKGSIVVECGNALLKNGYKLKILNTINFSKSMHYNPFSYVHSEKDILKLVTTLMTNTKGDGSGGDPFWEKSERLLLTALIAYLHYEAPKEEQNFSTLLEMLNTMQVSEDDEDFQNPVDLLFEDTVMRYLQYSTLQQKKLTHFDCWASTFGETTTAIELAPEGTGYRARTRFAKFFNLPELMSMFKEVADIKTSDQLHLPVPDAKFETVVVKPSETQKAMVQELSRRAAEIHSGNVDASVDNMLCVTNDGRKIGLDVRLMNPMLPDDPNSKLNVCVRNVLKIWEEGKDQKLTQLLFCDLSTPKNDGNFNVYDDIRKKLIAAGVPENEIEFIHNADTEAKKAALFSKVRSGDVRVLLGSTAKMGAGTNVQQRLVAVHHLDVGWKPSDMTQRNGRIIRQGNMNKEVNVFNYVTEGTFDSYLFQTLENKQRFISQIMTSKSPVRSCDDVDEQALSYAEIKALCVGNPLIKEKMDLDVQVAKLKVLKADHQSQKFRLEDKLLTKFPAEIQEQTAKIAALKSDAEIAAAHPQDKENFCGMVIKGMTYDEKKTAGERLILACMELPNTEEQVVGSYRGFELSLRFDTFHNEHQALLKGTLKYPVPLGSDPHGNIVRLDNALSNFADRSTAAENELDTLRQQQAAAQVEVAKPFPQEEELAQKSARLAELNAQLDVDEKHHEPEQDEEEKEDAPRRSVLAVLEEKAEKAEPVKPFKSYLDKDGDAR